MTILLSAAAVAGAVTGGYNVWRAGQALGAIPIHVGAAAQHGMNSSGASTSDPDAMADARTNDSRMPSAAAPAAVVDLAAPDADTAALFEPDTANGPGLPTPLNEDADLRAALEELLEDPDPAVRREAAEILDLWLPD